MALEIKLTIFEGPFDLLCHLLDENRVDIYDIPIAEITAQYIAYLDEMRAFDLEVASEFLVLAATLIAIKAKMLLPRVKPNDDAAFPEEFYGDDPRADLVRQILEYKKYKELAQSFTQLQAEREKRLPRPNDEAMYIALLHEDEIFRGFSTERLHSSMTEVMSRLGNKPHVHMVGRENITVNDQMRLIEARLAANPQGFLFGELYGDDVSRLRVIVIFLALLEMIKRNRLLCLQNVNGGDIYLFPPAAVKEIDNGTVIQ